MSHRTRREVFQDVGKGMLVAGLGAGVAAELGLAPAWAAEEPARLSFGRLDPLVDFFQSTQPDKLLPQVVEKLRTGADLKQLVAAAALANARAFGGEDYVGFHTLMALPPAYHMSQEETDPKRAPLAVLKVLYRNSNRLKETNRATNDTLKPIPDTPQTGSPPNGEQLRDQVRKVDLAGAERTFARIARDSRPAEALDQILIMADDGTEVHRTVLVSRAWELIGFTGPEQTHALLRQSVHYCVNSEKNPNQVKYYQGVRDLLPKVLERHHLLGKPAPARSADDTWVLAMSETIFKSTPEQAAEAVAMALAEGFRPDVIADAIALTANQLVLRDEGRPKEWAQPNKPIGSIHGDSVGVHACDTANAWRHLSRAGDRRSQVTSLILGAYQAARDRKMRGEFLKWAPYPRAEHVEQVKAIAADALMKELEGAIREQNQARAAAITARIGAENPKAARQVFALFRGFAVSEDGALHAEKYYRTTSEEFVAARAAFKWRQLVGLARVTASEFGQPAPGRDEARKLMGV